MVSPLFGWDKLRIKVKYRALTAFFSPPMDVQVALETASQPGHIEQPSCQAWPPKRHSTLLQSLTPLRAYTSSLLSVHIGDCKPPSCPQEAWAGLCSTHFQSQGNASSLATRCSESKVHETSRLSSVCERAREENLPGWS